MKLYYGRQIAWTTIVVFFALSLLWVLLSPDEKVVERMHSNMMSMTTAAFQEAIIFSHMSYHAKKKGNGPQLDLLQLKGVGLDFNDKGFPVGIEHNNDSVKLPPRVRDCRHLWRTLLHPMRPLLESDNSDGFKVTARDGKCFFTSIKYLEQQIVYNTRSGLVSLEVR